MRVLWDPAKSKLRQAQLVWVTSSVSATLIEIVRDAAGPRALHLLSHMIRCDAVLCEHPFVCPIHNFLT